MLNYFYDVDAISSLVDLKNCPERVCADHKDRLGGRVCTNTALRLAARRLGQLYDEALAPLDIKATQLALMSEIDKLMGADQQGPTLQELADRLAIQLSAVTHALKPLVRDGIVEVRLDAKDRRTKHGVLTALGETRLSEAVVRWASANDKVEAILGSTLAANLRDLANRVASDAFLVAYRAEGQAAVAFDPR